MPDTVELPNWPITTLPISSHSRSRYLTGRSPKTISKVKTSPAGYLVKSISDGYDIPTGFTPAVQRLKEAEAKKARDQAAAAERRREHEAEARETRERKEAAAYWEALTPEQQAELQATADAVSNPADLALEKGPLKRMGQRIRREAYIRQLLRERKTALFDA